MILILYCDTCVKEIGRSDVNDIQSFTSLIMLTHAGGQHCCNHKLRPHLLLDLTNNKELEGLTLNSSSQHELAIQCNHFNCKNSVVYKNIPLILTTAIILSYHSGHEGHPLTILIDGKNFGAI